METIQTQTPLLTVTEQPSIGSPWIGLSAPMPRRVDNAQPSMQPFVDIYSEVVKLDDKIESLLTQQAVTHNSLIIFIEEYRSLPWVRLWNWLSGIFSGERT